MSRPYVSLGLFAAVLLGIGCGADAPAPTAAETIELPIFSHKPSADGFTAQASGDEEVPARDTRARGFAQFRLIEEDVLGYQLIVANIENVVQSHIHVGPVGENGPVVAFLFGPVPAGGGRTDGVLAQGTIAGANLTGPLAGQPLSALLAEMKAGNTYVNVHTDDGIAPPNTGPGDFPGGEVRGQIHGAGSQGGH